MSYDDIPNDDYQTLFSLDPSHRLTLSRRQEVKRRGHVFKSQWLDEYDANNQLIARLRAWSSQSQQSSYIAQRGWERFSLSGQLLDREVRYYPRQSTGYLH